MTDYDLNQILLKAVAKNSKYDITGMLLYVHGKFINQVGGRFIQVLEGDEAVVKNAYEKIKSDLRHTEITIINQCAIKTRNFPSWSMGFQSLNTTEFKHRKGHFNLDHTFLQTKSPKAINVPLTFLKSFYSMNLIDQKPAGKKSA